MPLSVQTILTPVLTHITRLGLSEEGKSSFTSVILCHSFLKELDFLPKLNCREQASLRELLSAFVDASGSCTA